MPKIIWQVGGLLLDLPTDNRTEASESNEKTKKVLETSLSNLDEELNKLKESYDELLSHKTELEANFAREKEFYETKIDLLEKEKNQVSSDFDILSKSYENMERIVVII